MNCDKNMKVLLEYGRFHRIWPNTDDKGNIYASVSAIRSFVKPVCKLFKSNDYGNSWIELADFYSMDPRNTTTGQPFISKEGFIFVPVWDAGYYQFGKTWLTLYRSIDGGNNWEAVYSNPQAIYGKHFFQNNCTNELYLCASIGGGGTKGKVSYAPSKGILLHSKNFGKNWKICLEVSRPTALYDGIAFENTILVTARELGSIFRSVDNCVSWNEIKLGRAARNISKIKNEVYVSSDSSLFVSRDNGLSWTERSCPIKNVVLRYPTLFQDKVLMTAVGSRSLILATQLRYNKWQVAFDITKIIKTNFMTRLAILKDYLILGDEIEVGTLLRIPLSSIKYKYTFPYSIMTRLNSKKMYATFDSDR